MQVFFMERFLLRGEACPAEPASLWTDCVGMSPPEERLRASKGNRPLEPAAAALQEYGHDPNGNRHGCAITSWPLFDELSPTPALRLGPAHRTSVVGETTKRPVIPSSFPA